MKKLNTLDKALIILASFLFVFVVATVVIYTIKDWQYDTLENLVRKATGDPDKAVLLFGITNDAMAYI